MITKQEALEEIKNYQNDNEKVIKELEEEISKKIREAAKKGHKKTIIDLRFIWTKLPSYKEEGNTKGLENAIKDKLLKNGFCICDTGYDLRIEW